MPESARPNPLFLTLLVPLTAASLPSLVYCALAMVMRLHGIFTSGQTVLHMPPETGWDALLALEANVLEWLAQWNSLATLAATGFFVSTLLVRRWRFWTGLALIPYGVLLCADFTMRYAWLP
jgi:hypothetical protein